MRQFWLVVGSEKNWQVAFEHNNIWGLKDQRQFRPLWNMLREGDGLLFYVSKPVHGIVGVGYVATKFKQTTPLWPDEVKGDQVIWPLRFEFDVEYCLPLSLWKSKKYTSQDLQLVTRNVFQCYPIEEVNSARKALGLQPVIEEPPPLPIGLPPTPESASTSHGELKHQIAEIGRIQGYIAEEEYRLESTYLDVVWRRVQQSVPTFVFEVQIGGDIYHAMAKLKHAFDLWNSHTFLVANTADRSKYQELIAGSFHEVQSEMRFIEAGIIRQLIEKKLAYKEMELSLGILKR